MGANRDHKGQRVSEIKRAAKPRHLLLTDEERILAPEIDTELAWLVGFVPTGREIWAAAALEAKGFVAFVPVGWWLVRDPTVATVGREVQRPILPGYLFIGVERGRDGRPGARWGEARGVLFGGEVLRQDDEPQCVHAMDVAELAAAQRWGEFDHTGLRSYDGKPKSVAPPVALGARVRIVDGLFAQFEARVAEILPNMRLRLDVFGDGPFKPVLSTEIAWDNVAPA